MNYIWFAYRNWSFEILKLLVNNEEGNCKLLVTSNDCHYDFSFFFKKNIPVLKIKPKLLISQTNL